MELPTSVKRSLAVAMLRLAGLGQKDVAKCTRCANQTVVDVEKWLREGDFYKVARICDDQSIKKMVATEAIYWGLEQETLVKLDRITQDDILRHYRMDDYSKEHHPRNIALLSQRYLGDHYEKLNRVLKRFDNELCIPDLNELCFVTLESRTTISYGYADIAPLTYENGVVTLEVENSDSFLWNCLKEHLIAEFSDFNDNLGLWKRDIATLVKVCHSITKHMADDFTKTEWSDTEPYLSPDNKHYEPGAYYPVLITLMYQCTMANYPPKFERVPGSHGLILLVMEYPRGKKEIARGDSSLLEQVEQYCQNMIDEKTSQINKEAKQVSLLVRGLKSNQDLIKKQLRLVLERGLFKGICPACSDLLR